MEEAFRYDCQAWSEYQPMDEGSLVAEIQKIEAQAEEIVREAQRKATEREAWAEKEREIIALEYQREYDRKVEEIKRRLETQKGEEERQLKAHYEDACERLRRMDEATLSRMVERVVKRVCEE